MTKTRDEGGTRASSEADAWLDEEVGRNRFRDERLGKRFRLVLERLWTCMGQSIPMAFQDWCTTKAAYRFLSNPKVSEQDILGSHLEATRSRFAASEGPILILQDTTEFSYKRERPELIGSTHRVASRKSQGQDRAKLHAHDLRDLDAFESRRNHARRSVRAGSDKILDPEEVQRV